MNAVEEYYLRTISAVGHTLYFAADAGNYYEGLYGSHVVVVQFSMSALMLIQNFLKNFISTSCSHTDPGLIEKKFIELASETSDGPNQDANLS